MNNKTMCTDERFVELFTTMGAAATARMLGVGERAVYRRRNLLEDKLDRPLHPPHRSPLTEHNDRIEIKLKDGVILVGSDAHYWPSDKGTTAHRAFVRFCEDMKPDVVVMNGDAVDGASISRHPPRGFEDIPTVAEELSAVTERLAEIEDAAPKARRFWTLGNHDQRFEGKLAAAAREFDEVRGTRLVDHFEDWVFTYALLVNDNLMIKHRWKGGIHATHNNALWSGMTMVTGHLHSLKVTPLTDLTETRWGVDTGTLADIYGPQFAYAEENPRNWRSGFAILTIQKGVLRWPELVHVVEPGVVEFRGELIEV